MKAFTGPALALVLFAGHLCTSGVATTDNVAVSANPLGKVLELLDKLLAKAKQSKHDEVVQWNAYKQWCSDAEGAKQEQVKAADDQIELLNANLLKEQTEADRLDREIVGHEADIVEWTNSTGDATKDRADQHTNYETLHQDYSESVYALTEAIKVLKKQDYKRSQAAASLLAQIQAHPMPKEVHRAVETFLMQDPEEQDLQFVAPPDAHGYEFQSGAVVEMLEKLLQKFKDEQLALEKQEMTDRHNYQMTALDLRNSIAAAEHEIEKKKEWSAGHKQVHADTTGQLKLVTDTREADAKFLTELHTTCNQKAADFDSRQKLRGEEIEAIEKAVAILQSEAVSGAHAEHLPAAALLQRRNSALVQVERQDPASAAQDRAVTFLKGVSVRLGSHTLSALASQVQINPFTKVKKMIEDLIARLKAQEAEEAQHKEWCDSELGTNEQTRTTKTEEVETLHTTIDELTNRISVLEKEVSVLSREVAQIAADMAKAAALRAKEKARNEDTIADAVAAQMELTKAIALLKDFYANAAGATVLQVSQSHVRQPEAPPIFDAPYTASANAKEKNNIVAFLDVINSDFARLEGETKKAEEEAAQDHEETETQAKADKAAKEADITAKNKEKDEKSGDLTTAHHNLELAQSQLDAAMAYYDKLKPSCLVTSTESSHEDRVRRRESEIQALKEALSILSGETIPDGYAPDALYSGVDGGNFGWDTPTSSP